MPGVEGRARLALPRVVGVVRPTGAAPAAGTAGAPAAGTAATAPASTAAAGERDGPDQADDQEDREERAQEAPDAEAVAPARSPRTGAVAVPVGRVATGCDRHDDRAVGRGGGDRRDRRREAGLVGRVGDEAPARDECRDHEEADEELTHVRDSLSGAGRLSEAIRAAPDPAIRLWSHHGGAAESWRRVGAVGAVAGPSAGLVHRPLVDVLFGAPGPSGMC